MARKTVLPTVVPNASPGFRITPGIADLLNDDVLVKKIANAAPEIDRVLAQAQLDIVTEENRDSIGATCLALRVFRDIFATFKARGEAVKATDTSKK